MKEQKFVKEGVQLDENLVPPLYRTAAELKQVEDARIGREQTQIRQGFDNQPTAGHSRAGNAEVKQLQEAWSARAERAITMPRRQQER